MDFADYCKDYVTSNKALGGIIAECFWSLIFMEARGSEATNEKTLTAEGVVNGH